MNRATPLIAALLLASVALPMAVTAQSAFVTVSDVSVEPGSPMPGEPVTITPTITNSPDSTAPFRITDIAVRKAGSSSEYNRVEDVGKISPGQSIAVPITLTFEDRKTYTLRIKVYGENTETGEREQISYPLTLSVRGQHPGLSVQTQDPVVGIDETATVTVANGLENAISNVKVDIEGSSGVTVTGSDVVRARLASGATTRANVTYRPTTAGEHTIETTLTYTTSAGTVRKTTANTTIVAESLENDVVVDLRPVGTSSGTAIEARVFNGGNAPIRSVSLSGSSPNGSVSPTTIEEVSAGEARTALLNATLSEPGADVDVTVNYRVGTGTETITKSVRVSRTTGNIDLTGVEVTREGGRIRVSGSAANVGLSDADSVLVSVVDTDQVTPSAPSKEYFIGTVPASDFVTFDVYAETSGNASTVPVEVTYIVDGQRQSQVFRFEVPQTSAGLPGEQTNSNSGGGSNLLIPLAVGGVAIIVVGGVIARYYFMGNDEP